MGSRNSMRVHEERRGRNFLATTNERTVRVGRGKKSLLSEPGSGLFDASSLEVEKDKGKRVKVIDGMNVTQQKISKKCEDKRHACDEKETTKNKVSYSTLYMRTIAQQLYAAASV